MNICVVIRGFPPEVGGIEEYSSSIYKVLKEVFTEGVTAYVFETKSKAQVNFVRIEKSSMEIVNFLKLFYFER